MTEERMALFFEGTNGNDVFYTRTYTLEKDPDGNPFENSDLYYGYGGDDAFRVRASNVELSGLFETSSTIFGGEGNDSLVFAPARDYRGQVDVQFSGEAGTDTAKLDLSRLGSVSIDFTDVVGSRYTTIITLKHADGLSGGQFFLLDDVERIELIGSASSDVLIGNRGDDHLDGGAGADLFYETNGNDRYVFDDAGDTVARYEGSAANVSANGVDTIWATASVDLRAQYGVENLRLQSGDIDGTGDGAANLITGSAGSNRIAGGAGNDSLYGKGGADTFVFAEMGPADRDSIWDFGSDDRIELSGSVFANLDADDDGILDASALSLSGQAVGTDAQLIYSRTTGVLSYDADGSDPGAAQAIAFIGKTLGFLDHTDILIA
jgi:Ca2+-binding RTX toxin-like protein